MPYRDEEVLLRQNLIAAVSTNFQGATSSPELYQTSYISVPRDTDLGRVPRQSAAQLAVLVQLDPRIPP